MFSSAISIAQTDFNLLINHKLNAYDFDNDQYGMTLDSAIFKLSRMEYYLSEITITHDGGQETMISDLWVLVNAEEPTLVDLGSQSFTTVEAVSFSVGVDPAHNNLDPAIYQSGHPLAPKNPSMHWGWTAGYRFVAAEGEAYDGPLFQIHALGNSNYFKATVQTSSEDINGEQYITVYANYSRAFDAIDITNGVTNHGETDEALDLLLNFNQSVFTASAPTDTFSMPGSEEPSSISTIDDVASFEIAPNPSINNEVRFLVKASASFDVQLFDITGKLAYQANDLNANQMQLIANLNPGLYFLNINATDGSFSDTKRVIVK